MTPLILERSVAPRLHALTEIIAAVASVHQLDPAAILSTTRTKSITEARQCVYLLARRRTRLSLTEIGQALGRDHTTVMAGLASIEAKRARDPWLAGVLAELLEQFGELGRETRQ